jgi:hypothetical protein
MVNNGFIRHPIINCLLFVSTSRSNTGGDRRLQNMENTGGDRRLQNMENTGGDRRLQNMEPAVLGRMCAGGDNYETVNK